MSKKTSIILFVILIIIVGAIFIKKNVGNINFPTKASETTKDVAENEVPTTASLPGFTMPEGFSMYIYAKDVPGARVMETDSKGRLLVSETGDGKIVAISDTNNDGVADTQTVIAKDLKEPSGMAMKCDTTCYLYVAEDNELSRFPYDADGPTLGAQEKLMSIDHSKTDRHFSRSLVFLPSPNDTTLLISVGSTCNVCNEKSTDHASVLYYDLVTKTHGVYAKGLRNATFLALNPVDGKVFATEMGRDSLGDDIPPDEINIIDVHSTSSGQNSIPNFGWPNCYGKNIHDTDFDKNVYIRNPCMASFETPAFIDLQAHSAPLGLAFVPEDSPPSPGEAGGWPETYWNNLLVAYHGSWNRAEPTGYKIARIVLDKNGKYMKTEDFITGWLTKNGQKTGRPVDIKLFPGGTGYITDDSSGVVYKLSLKK